MTNLVWAFLAVHLKAFYMCSSVATLEKENLQISDPHDMLGIHPTPLSRFGRQTLFIT